MTMYFEGNNRGRTAALSNLKLDEGLRLAKAPRRPQGERASA